MNDIFKIKNLKDNIGFIRLFIKYNKILIFFNKNAASNGKLHMYLVMYCIYADLHHKQIIF